MTEGRLFLRSRRADVNVQRILDKMHVVAYENGVWAEEAIVDRGNSRDLD